MAPCQAGSFFDFPVWWKYLVVTQTASGCDIAFVFPGDIWAVGLAVIEILLRIAGFVAVIAVVITGIRYMTAQGNPEKAASARKGLYNAIAGLLIALVATALVAFIGNILFS